eukprot:c9923_g1_i2.p1 GENE.c9923_g1_i2~~c9923_g1_i2.p1  ORF type:complete len:112 (-),score=21.56 c9923_g1_i2:2-337(-)
MGAEQSNIARVSPNPSTAQELYKAVISEDLAQLRAILTSEPAWTNRELELGWAALHWAARHGTESVVQVLYEMGANVNIQDENGFTPMYVAARAGRHRVIKLLHGMGGAPS